MAAAEFVWLQRATPPPVLNIMGNAEDIWKRFKQQFELRIKATGASKMEDEQANDSVFDGWASTLEINHTFQTDD